jgi:hypothetical protein
VQGDKDRSFELFVWMRDRGWETLKFTPNIRVVTRNAKLVPITKNVERTQKAI